MREFVLLVEGFDYQILNEDSRLEWLTKTYGTRLARAFQLSPHIDTDVADAVAHVTRYDPSPNLQFSQWLCVRLIKEDIFIEDLYKARQYLDVFRRAETRIKPNDINAYKNLNDLYDAVQPFMGDDVDLSSADEKRRLDKEMRAQSEMLVDTDRVRIVVPKTEAASCYWGKNTQWCTAATGGDNYFAHYGRLYVIIDKKVNKRFQIELDSDQWMDENDRRVSWYKVIAEYPEVVDAVGRDQLIRYHRLPISMMSEHEIRERFTSNSSPSLRFYEALVRCLNTTQDVLAIPTDILQSDNFCIVLSNCGRQRLDLIFSAMESAGHLTLEFFKKILSKERRVAVHTAAYVPKSYFEDPDCLEMIYGISQQLGGSIVSELIQQLPRHLWGIHEYIHMAMNFSFRPSEVPAEIWKDIPENLRYYFDHSDEFEKLELPDGMSITS